MAAEDVRAFCRRTRPPTVLLHNIYDFAVALSAADADALEEEVGLEMSKFGRVLDAEAVAGTVKVYFDATESAMRCATALDGTRFDGRAISARYVAASARRGASTAGASTKSAR